MTNLPLNTNLTRDDPLWDVVRFSYSELVSTCEL